MPRRTATAEGRARSGGRLSREAIVDAAVALADRDGLGAVSMRRLAQELEVDPMSIYHHVRDKDALLVAMTDAVLARIEDADPGLDAPWTERLRAHIMAARRAVSGHPWAARILADQTDASPAVLRRLDQMLGIMRSGGCSVDLGHHAVHLLGSRLLGFSQDLFDDSERPQDEGPSPEQLAQWAVALPHVAELAMAASHAGPLGGCDDEFEFAFAVDVLLEGLERRRVAESGA
ncbi:TetR/AcrR family transcriptional regulator [Microbacterium thalassium]|uniref:AcrR family transcriptional regulator n=1 Tax=Microbacterium thalassium TaxID=362649 RepID=A0A7X0FMX9_9MICO|nr:TetR/AcrR family transcriptional regulator C-terminal domain-containing protein [Microbacterium thalassium]MBB6390470.1 AcrR family transcriptional regulator [Microbacterium thalassium]GLK25580.1 TetR family transcriptional regulator [Microbacterium thalassium]